MDSVELLSRRGPSIIPSEGSRERTIGKDPENEPNFTAGLQVTSLRKTYADVRAVDDLSFRVAHGEILGLIGPNGAGKSTTMMMIVGLLKPDDGMIRFDGRILDWRDARDRSLLGIVPQELAIYPQISARQNLQFFGRLYGLRGEHLKDRVDRVLEMTGLAPHADRNPQTFSGGMQRRLNFGVALVHAPQLVILDEPTVGVDPQSRTNLLDCIRELRRTGCCVVYASHYMEEIESICDRVAIVDRGRMLRQGTLEELLDSSRFQVSIKTVAISPSLDEQLRHMADSETLSDGTTRILVQQFDGEARGIAVNERLRAVLTLLECANMPLLEIESRENGLEGLFLRLTGRKLRD